MKLPDTKEGWLELIKNDKNYQQLLKDNNWKIEDCTCFDCDYQIKCQCAYDLYNYNGDCLESK